jgi:hypothetical protein
MTTLPEHLLAALLDLDDNLACRAVADWLEENGAPEAADVRLLASVVPAIPPGPPGWKVCRNRVWRREADYPGDGSVPSHLVLAEAYPVACGSWWTVEMTPHGIFGRVHQGSAVMNRLDLVDDGREFRHWGIGAALSPTLARDDACRRAFEIARRQLIGLALGEDLYNDGHGEKITRRPLGRQHAVS